MIITKDIIVKTAVDLSVVNPVKRILRRLKVGITQEEKVQTVKIKLLISALVLVGSITVATAHNTTPCNTPDTNRENSGQNFTISGTPVTVLAANGNRCSAAIVNVGANDVNCTSRGRTPSTTIGATIKPGGAININLDSGVIQQWQCHNVSGDSTVSVWEGYK